MSGEPNPYTERPGAPERRIRVAVIFGGRSDEHDVSLRSAQTVINALDPERFEVLPVGITRDGRWLAGGDPMAALTAESPLFAVPASAGVGATDSAHQNGRGLAVPLGQGGETPKELTTAISSVFNEGIDVVFPVLHGPWGEDGTIQGMFELAGVPYVGSGVLGSALGMDKGMAKTILAQAGLPQTEWMLVQRRDIQRDPSGIKAEIAERLGFPCFVKPANLGSSVGVTKVHGPDELEPALELAAHYDRRVIIEKGVDAREIEVSVLGNDDPRASVPGEIIPGNEFYDYDAKYVDGDSELIIPADLPGTTVTEVQELAVAAFRALDLAGMARVDFFVERKTGKVLINEVNTIPGFTVTSMYPLLWEASGLPINELVETLITLAVERHAERGNGL